MFFFSYLITQTSFVFTHIRTRRHKKKKKKKRRRLAAEHGQQTRKKKDQEKKEMKTDHTVTTTTTATKDKKKKEKESNGRAHTHTHAHHHQNGTRDEVKKRRDRQKKTAHKRETWWLNNEQKIHTNSLIQARRLRETRRKTGEGKKKQTNKQLISCLIS
jgi:hypothetical protein